MTDTDRAIDQEKADDIKEIPAPYELFMLGNEYHELYLRYQKIKKTLSKRGRRYMKACGGPMKYDDYDVKGDEICIYYKGKIVDALNTLELVDEALKPVYEYVGED